MNAYPQIFRVRQHWDRPRVADIPAEVAAQLEGLNLRNTVRPGQSVAITAGSRGIAQIAVILRGIVQYFQQALEAQPFLVPAMGSHGGGTAAGQRRILASYGITEEFCGCPIRASMDTVVLGQAAEGFPIYFDRLAHQADHVFLCARVKPHTMFVGRIESGLMKMLLIGLGKLDGAKIYHRAILDYNFDHIVRSVGRRVLRECSILGGLAILENAYDEVAELVGLRSAEIEDREPELLDRAKRRMPRLPFPAADILLVDEIGKDISGTGMDTNIIGRKFHDHAAAADEFPKIRRIVVRGLTAATHGGAQGIGAAEFCTNRVARDMDVRGTWLNGLTSNHMSGAVLPMHFETDREILDAALPTLGLVQPPKAKLLWIKNTLKLSELECSAAYLPEAQGREDLEVLTGLRDLPLDASGNLPQCIA
jgi:hypothetical protein